MRESSIVFTIAGRMTEISRIMEVSSRAFVNPHFFRSLDQEWVVHSSSQGCKENSEIKEEGRAVSERSVKRKWVLAMAGIKAFVSHSNISPGYPWYTLISAHLYAWLRAN